MRAYQLLVLVAVALLGCNESPSEPRARCESRAPNVRYDVPDMGDWRAELLASIADVPDDQSLYITFLINRMPTTADSVEIVSYGGRPDWYWVAEGRSPLPVTMQAVDMRRFLREAKLDYVFDSVLPYYGCLIQARATFGDGASRY